MNWFRRIFRTGNDGRKTRDEGRTRPPSFIPHPSSLVLRPSSLNYALFLFFALRKSARTCAAERISSGGVTGGLLRKKIMNDGGGCFHAGGRNKPSGAKLSERLPESLKLPFFVFNGHACVCFFGNGQNKQNPWQLRKLLMRQLSSPFLVTSISGMNEKTSNDEYNAGYAEEKSKLDGKFFKKIAGQTDGENGIPQGVNASGDEFSWRIINGCFHRLNDTTLERDGQAFQGRAEL